jgi:hypothetical protein
MLYVAPVLVGLLYVLLMSLLREPGRRRFNAIMVAGAGAAYLSSGGGLGPGEFVFTAAVTYCAYRGLDSYAWIGIAWLLHAAWDVVHYVRGAPIIPFATHSSLGCAICDPIIALWCLRGGPSLRRLVDKSGPEGPAEYGAGGEEGEEPARVDGQQGSVPRGAHDGPAAGVAQ